MRPAGSNKHNLTAAQEKYCRERAKGKTQAEAYRAANKGSEATKKTQAESACRMEKMEKIRKRIEELQAQVDAGLIPTLEQIQTDVANMAADESRPDAIRLKAYDQLTRMRGGYKDTLSVSAGVSIDDRRAALADLLPGGADPIG